jgi:threonine/homoserine/homoserine lactone efflux protein
MLATLVIAFSQVVFGLLSDVVPARELLAWAGAVVLLYAGAWWLVSRREHGPDATPHPAGD